MLYHITFTGVRRMKKSPYDRERFFEKYSQMDRSRLGLAGAGEWESLEPLLPDFAGKRVLDLGCGYGWHCGYAAGHGAAYVLGTDLSEKMLALHLCGGTRRGVCHRRGPVGENAGRGPGKDHGSAGDLYPGGYGGDPIPAGEL